MMMAGLFILQRFESNFKCTWRRVMKDVRWEM